MRDKSENRVVPVSQLYTHVRTARIHVSDARLRKYSLAKTLLSSERSNLTSPYVTATMKDDLNRVVATPFFGRWRETKKGLRGGRERGEEEREGRKREREGAERRGEERKKERERC